MKCDRCDREATLHDLKLIKGGVASEVHLCEKCAAELGVAGKNFATVDELLQQAIGQQAGTLSISVQITGEPSAAKPGVCPNCATTWSEFRERGLFGCPECYVTFEDRIGAVLERAHEGGTHHVGKCPSHIENRVEHEARIRHLRRQMEDAIASEQYERAAELRDEINKEMSRAGESASESSSSAREQEDAASTEQAKGGEG